MLQRIPSVLIALWLSTITVTARSVSGKLFTGEVMSSSSVTSLCQDQAGFLWIGTGYGLNRFDGYHFNIFLHDSSDSTSLPHNEVCTLLSDSEGRLWAGVGNALARYDFGQNCFINMLFPNNIHPRVNDLIETCEGDIYAFTAGEGVFVLRKGTQQLMRDDALNALTQDKFFCKPCEDTEGNLWGSTREGDICCVVRRQGKAKAIRKYRLTEGQVQDFGTDGEGRLLSLFPKTILYYDKITDTWKDAGYQLDELTRTTGLASMIYSRIGGLYIATHSKGVKVIRKGKSTPEDITFNNLKFKIDQVPITKLMEDRDGNLWVGCFRKGLALLNKQHGAFHNWAFSPQTGQDTDIHLSSMTTAEDGGIWCSSWEGHILHYDKNGKAMVAPYAPEGASNIYRGRDGQYWLGAAAGLYQYDPIKGDCKLVLTIPGWVNTICDDGKGHLYISEFGKGFIRYDKQTGHTRRYTSADRSNKGHLCNNWIGYMMVDSRNNLWISTSNGVSCMDLRDDNFKPYGWGVLLEHSGCGPLSEDADGNIVIGSFSGLYLYDRKQNKLTPYPDSWPLKDKTICGLACDQQGDLWISTPMGIWQYASAKKLFIPYQRGSGIVSREYVLNLFVHGANDLVSFATNDGITVFNPQEVKKSRQEIGKVYLSEVNINGRWASPFQDMITIPYDESSFSLNYSLLRYEITEAVSYEYRLNEGEWQANVNGGSNILSFNRMRPGTYRIEVRACYGENYSRENSLLTVVVRAPWYATVWAYLGYSLLGLLLIGLALNYYMREKRMQLEEEKMHFLMNTTHDIRSPLTLIVGPLQRLKDSVADEKGKACIETIERNAQKLMMLVNQILDERKIDKGLMQLYCQETNIVELVSGTCKLYQYEARQRNIAFTFEHELNNVPLWVDRMNFDKVISNLLSNAFKYTSDSGEVKVTVKSEKGAVIIQVVDSGVGFRKGESTKQLFECFHQGKNTVNLSTQGTGIGLNLCRSIVEMHGGHIMAGNRSDGRRGACFSVRLPMGNKHLKPNQIVDNKNKSEVLSTSTDGGQYKNIRVMLVDDNPDILEYIRLELSGHYRFAVCKNGKVALKALLTDGQHYDIVVSDVMMPEMDGITLLKNIKENPRTSELPVILLTSRTEAEYRLEGLKKGADAYIAKPFDMEELHVQIDNLVGNMRRLRGVFSGASTQKGKLEDVEVKGNNDALMERVMKSINAHLSEADYNVDSLAQEVGISRAQLHRKMKEITGLPTGKFLRNLRMEQAKRLIHEGKVNVTQVAYSVGFNDQTHFSTVFKNYFGISPSEYAEKEKA